MMRTITFYSYKGGVGRSLLVANAAKYLSILGKKVFALDLDLEAPGLHYKFELGRTAQRSEVAPGIVDILAYFLKNKALPESLDRFTTQVKVASGAGSIYIMRAGTAPLGDYWRQLSRVSWYDLFYGPNPIGAPFFLELKGRIREKYNPDFLLIDSRTGITEMGGVATTLLPDTVVCVALASVEHLEGLRAAMQGINQTTMTVGAPVKQIAVISRLPFMKEEDRELENILVFLKAPVTSDVPKISLDEVVTLHSEPALDAEERILIGGQNGPSELPLLRDYLKLFSKIIPVDDIRPHVGKLIKRAVDRFLDDPDIAQNELEALTTYCADQEAYRALLKLYRIRRAPHEKMLATAAMMWQLRSTTSEPSDQLLVDIIKAVYAEYRPGDVQKRYAEFAESVWRQSNVKDMRILMNIVSAYLPDRRDRGIKLLLDYAQQTAEPSPVAVVRLIDLLRGESSQLAFEIIEKFKATIPAPEFHVAWARLVAKSDNSALSKQLLEDSAFRPDSVRVLDPASLYRVLKKAEDATADDFLRNALDEAVASGNTNQLQALGAIFYTEGNIDELEYRLERLLPDKEARQILSNVRKNARQASLPLR